MARMPLTKKGSVTESEKPSEVVADVTTNETQDTPVVTETPVPEVLPETNNVEAEPVTEPEDASEPEVVEDMPVVREIDPPAEPTYLTVSEDIHKSNDAKMKSLVLRLDKFAHDNMPGKIVSLDQGARNDVAFWATIKDVLSQPVLSEFRRQWSVVILFFKHHENGVCADRYVNRFISHWTITFQEANAFRAIVNLLKISTDKRSRELALKSVNLPRLTNALDNEQSRQNVMMFYTN